MIAGFRHRGRKTLYELGDSSLIRTDLVDRIEVILGQLDVAKSVAALRIPNYHLHSLVGDRKGFWSVTVKTNWRIIFRMDGQNVRDVELIDYH